ncbi:MAG: TIGR00366 family protein, partial [Planctomycetota bacterium]
MERLGGQFARVVQRVLPDPMVIACGLTLLVAAIALLAPPSDELAALATLPRIPAVARMWLDTVWNTKFLEFALQMCVVLLTGYGLAKAPLATRLLHSLAALATSNRSAVLLVTAVSCVGCWINWGFGLIAAGVLAARLRQELAAKGIRCQYALIVAGAYAGMMIWHGGLSGSAPLKVAKDGVTVSRTVDGAVTTERLAAISIGSTTLSPGNLLLTAILCIGIPLLMRSMGSAAPREAGDPSDAIPATDRPAHVTPADAAPPAESAPPGIADRINRSRVIPFLIAAVAIVALGSQIHRRGTAAVNLNFVNTVFLTLGLLLHRNLIEYVAAVAEGGRAVTGIVLQFPLYSGIQGIMFGAGIAAAMSQAFVDAAQWSASAMNISPGHTFPIATFLSAGLVNLFVPSGGGQWIVQGPIMCSA